MSPQLVQWRQNAVLLNNADFLSWGNMSKTLRLSTMVLMTLSPRITTALWMLVMVCGIP